MYVKSRPVTINNKIKNYQVLFCDKIIVWVKNKVVYHFMTFHTSELVPFKFSFLFHFIDMLYRFVMHALPFK